MVKYYWDACMVITLFWVVWDERGNCLFEENEKNVVIISIMT